MRRVAIFVIDAQLDAQQMAILGLLPARFVAVVNTVLLAVNVILGSTEEVEMTVQWIQLSAFFVQLDGTKTPKVWHLVFHALLARLVRILVKSTVPHVQ